MKRSFDHFPEIKVCPICGTNEDKECFLIPIDGTDEDDGKICQAHPFHVNCIEDYAERFRFHRDMGLLYMHTKKEVE